MAATILFVSADPFYRAAWEALLYDQGYKLLAAATGEAALLACPYLLPDLIVFHSLLPDMKGTEACRRLKTNPRNSMMLVVLMAEASGAADFSAAREAGANDFWQEFHSRDELLLRVRSILDLKSSMDRQAAGVIISLAQSIEARNRFAYGRAQRTSNFAVRFGKSLGLREEDLEALHLAGQVHDVGNLRIPDAILLKRDPLSLEEMKLVEHHPIEGERICAPLRSFRSVLPILRHHHERLDGSGYPDGLRGGQIPLNARIFHIVDICEALTNDRPQRGGVSLPAALTILYEEVEMGWLDPDLVTHFASLVIGRDRAMALARSCGAPAIQHRRRRIRF